MKAATKRILYFAAAVLISVFISAGATVFFMNRQRGDRVVLSSEEYQVLNKLFPLSELIKTVKTEHYGEQVSDARFLEGALKGAASCFGDPYARYFTEEEYSAYLTKLEGEYNGIGVIVGQPDSFGVPVLKVYAESPAQTSGLQIGDRIVSVDGILLLGLSLEEVELMFAGEKGSEVSLEIMRKEQKLELTIVRGIISTSRVDNKLFLQRSGYIRIDKFTGTAGEEFHEALRDLNERGMRSLIIDLRNNPGGELQQVVSIADALLGDCMIVAVKQANGDEQIYRSDVKGIGVPLAVLVNENSASASEILAAAVKDNKAGIVVGKTTYGKGVVQTTLQLKSNGGWLKLTTAAYYTPNGYSVDGLGVQPDIDVDLAADIKDLPIDLIEQDDDAQLWAALDEVRALADERNN